MKTKILSILGAAAAMTMAASVSAGTLDDVRKRGHLQCGINTGLPGFAAPDDKGVWRGFDVDFCRAVTAAVFGDASKVKYTNLTGKTRFTALRSGEIDLLSRNTTWTFSRDVDLQLTFVGVNYYDGQGFMVPKGLNVNSAKKLGGASVCIQTGTTTELNLADYFRGNGMKYEPVPIETNAEARTNYLAGRCDVYTTDASGLSATRASLDKPDAHVVLPEIISKEPLGPLVRQGDDQWADIARWTLNVLIAAEELGITSKNVKSLAGGTKNPEINRLLGSKKLQGREALGLSADWAVNVISQVGNYGEIFEANLGPKTALGIGRGHNAQWKDGGLLYAPPFR
ncbi:MAG: amino acid ABC transporter substrate-binding protein [Rhodospirillales bacterium]|jgi:general L-amino acid transport system substrate-binding protein|nr:amino acid ABC transporter substrate-binding protein [Rhodospirillales bacterium]MDP6643041.1 amino acid ABC transporter substrate-binding protein [Rhodospirillales bacterium]MDP6842647.1 amino acid ABC transporter substrate-binding protein [Rhodospirillales bacterium]